MHEHSIKPIYYELLRHNVKIGIDMFSIIVMLTLETITLPLFDFMLSINLIFPL